MNGFSIINGCGKLPFIREGHEDDTVAEERDYFAVHVLTDGRKKIEKLNFKTTHNRLKSSGGKNLGLSNLSVQLSLIALGIPTLVLVLFEIHTIRLQTVGFQNELDLFLRNEAVQLSTSLSSSLFSLDDQTIEMICKAALAKPRILKITVRDGSREYLRFEDESYSPEYIEKGIRRIEYPIVYRYKEIGEIEIVVTTVFLAERIKKMKTNSLYQVMAVNLILGLVLFAVLIVKFIKPLRELKQSSEKIAAGDLYQPITIRRNDEIGALADNLTLMRDAVKDQVESLQAEVERHHQTAMALEKSESFLRLIIDLIPHMIFVKNFEGRFLVVNQAMADSLESTVEAATGKSHFDLISDTDHVTGELRDDRQVIQSRQTKSVLSKSLEPSSNRFQWFSTKKVPFKAPDGDEGIIGVTIDISELKQTEQALQETKQYIDNIINSMPSALFSLDNNSAIVLWNRKAEELYGIKTAQAVSNPVETVLPQMLPYVEKIAEAVENQTQHYFPKQFRYIGQRGVFEDITVYPLTAGVKGAVIRVDDVTEHVRMEEMVIQSEKMLSVGGLAAGMAHEINNPLAGMIQNTQVVLQRIRGGVPASVRAAEEEGMTMGQVERFMEKRGILLQLELIREAGSRATEIVRNMLSFSRKEVSGRIKEDIVRVMDKTIELAKSDYNLKKQYDFKKIKIVKEYDSKIPMVDCEPSKIQQVFFNILKNSAEAMQENDATQPPQFIIRIFHRASYACIEIEDNGPGMTEDVKKRIFEPFFTTKSVGEGTGLGLSVSYFIIADHHKGKMNVLSEPGKGTIFVIQLPIS